MTARRGRLRKSECGVLSLRRAPLVMFQQPTERLVTDDFVQAEFVERRRWRQIGVDRCISEPLVRTEIVIVDHPLLKNMPQMIFAKDDEVVETFSFCSPHPALRVRIQIRTAWWDGPEINTVGFQDGAEFFGELGIAITNDVRRLELSLLFAENHAHISSHYRHPTSIRIGCHAGNMNASRVQMNEKQHVIRNRPTHCPDGFREEIGGPNSFEVHLNEIAPTAAPTFRTGIETVLLQDAANRGSGDVVNTELPEFTENSPVAPAGLLGHFDNELTDLFRFPRPSSFAKLHSRFAFAEPASKGSRMDDGNDILDFRPKPRAELQQFGPFRRSHVDPFGKLISKNPVLGLQILDHLDELFFRGTSEEQQERVDESLHGSTMRKSFVDLEVA